MIKCCKGCDERYMNCHCSCETYLNEKKRHDMIKAERRKEADVTMTVAHLTRERRKRWLK